MDDNRPREVVVSILLFEPNADKITDNVTLLRERLGFSDHSAQLLIVILDELWMLDNAQNVHPIPRLFLLHEESLPCLPFAFRVLRFPPHQAEPSSDGLLQKNRGCAGTERNDDADIVDIEALTEHQD